MKNIFSLLLVFVLANWCRAGDLNDSRKIPIQIPIQLESGETNIENKTVFVTRQEIKQIVDKKLQKRWADEEAKRKAHTPTAVDTFQICFLFQYDGVRVYRFVDPSFPYKYRYYTKQITQPDK